MRPSEDRLTAQLAGLERSFKFSPWTKRHTPDGKSYFTSEDGDTTGYTSVNVSGDTVRKLAEAKLDKIRAAVKEERPELAKHPSQIDIVLEAPATPPPPEHDPPESQTYPLSSSPAWRYCVIDCMRRCIVFLCTVLVGLVPMFDVMPVDDAGNDSLRRDF